jgi:diguanylate cyclase (GGDEF)-like protein
MQTFESVAARILEPISELLRKPLALVDGQSSQVGGAFAIRLSSPRVAIVSTDEIPFSEGERRLIDELFGVVRLAGESEARYEELEQRMLSLQRENLDLIVKNRLLSEVSSRDALTGLYNRWFVMEKIDSEMNRAVRHGSPMSLLMLDIDHFKRVNDTWGHGAGDQVLQGIGQLLRDSCRVYDVPGRYGGEEFCIVLPETKPGSTGIVAERIRSRIEATTMACGDTSIVVTASIGIAGMEMPESSDLLSPAALIDRADRALYSAKNRGRNRVEMWDHALFEGGADATSH